MIGPPDTILSTRSLLDTTLVAYNGFFIPSAIEDYPEDLYSDFLLPPVIRVLSRRGVSGNEAALIVDIVPGESYYCEFCILFPLLFSKSCRWSL